MRKESQSLRLGIDAGSTTAKAVVLDIQTGAVLFSRYQRHHAEQARTVRQLLAEVDAAFPERRFRIAVCGSGGKPIAEAMGVHYIQEVVANAAAVRALYPQTRTAIEMGGQDAKIIFFYYNEAEGRLIASDMRMNGSRAGGTGVFIDEVAVAMAKYQGDCRLSHYSALLRRAIGDFCAIPYDRSRPRPRVFVTGEYLVTFHPGSNFHIEEYLESNGMEVILPRMTNVFRKDYLSRLAEMKDYRVRYPPWETICPSGAGSRCSRWS